MTLLPTSGRRNRARSRLLALAVALLTVLATTVATAPSASAACGTSGCGPYYIQFKYAGGTVVTYSYVSQWEWMHDTTTAVKRGVTQVSGYSYIDIYDSKYDMEIYIAFCETGPRCAARPTSMSSLGHAGWQARVGGCTGATYQTYNEATAWVNFVKFASDVDLGGAHYASLKSAAGNVVSESRC